MVLQHLPDPTSHLQLLKISHPMQHLPERLLPPQLLLTLLPALQHLLERHQPAAPSSHAAQLCKLASLQLPE